MMHSSYEFLNVFNDIITRYVEVLNNLTICIKMFDKQVYRIFAIVEELSSPTFMFFFVFFKDLWKG